jgi:ABC-type multidrug transport system ATPase subunit
MKMKMKVNQLTHTFHALIWMAAATAATAASSTSTSTSATSSIPSLTTAVQSSHANHGYVGAVTASPQITPNCITAIQKYAANYQASYGESSSRQCPDLLASVISDSASLYQCLEGGPGNNAWNIDCTSPDSVVNGAQIGGNEWLYRPYYIPSTPSSCQFCNTTCSPLLSAVASVAGEMGTADQMAVAGSTEVFFYCSNFYDSAQLTGLYYQSELLCNSTKTFGYDVTPVLTLNGVLDMRSLFQCSKCSMIPCFPGQYCGKNSKAKMCPAGSYCPLPPFIHDCPEGHYCPLGSTEPTKCRSIAAGSCSVGAAREVVWVPLLISLLFMCAAAVICVYPPNWLQVLLGKLQSTKIPKSGLTVQLLSPQSNTKSLMSNKEEQNRICGVRIEFEDLVMISGNNTRLDSLSGKINPGRFTAIVGGSGAGKTTLMNVLLSREYKTSGTVNYYVEGCSQSMPPHILEKIVAFVPQTDVLLCEMTVYQLLKHSAVMRLPPTTSLAEIDKRVEYALEKLEISHIRDVIAKRSSADSDVLSPGDKKKVSIAIELVAEPRVVFLDEPTTGIDASSAMSVSLIIKNLAATGVTCVAVIHQPRAEIFHLIDDIIILVPGGRVAYDGPAEYALKWFAKHGFHLYNPKTNKADFILDITSGNYNPSLLTNKLTDEEAVSKGVKYIEDLDTIRNVNWSKLWTEGGHKFLETMQELHDSQLPATRPRGETQESMQLLTHRRGFLAQFVLCFVRGVLQRLKAFGFVVGLTIAMLGGSIIGIVTSGGPLILPALPPTYVASCPPGSEFECRNWLRFELGPATFLITMLLGATTFPLTVSTFGREKEYFARESAVGCDKTSYFLGKVLADLMAVMIFTSFVFVSALNAIAPWTAPFELLFLVVLSITFSVGSIGYFISLLISDPDNAVLVGVILSILLNLFGGFVPTLGDGVVGKIFFTHYAARAICTVELQQGMGLTKEQYDEVVPDAWMDPNWHIDIAVLWGMGCFWLLLSYGMLIYKNPRRYRA